MRIKCYFKKTWSIVYLLAGVLFSFRGCFQRHVSFEARQESDQLLMFYNTLSSDQQATLLEVCQNFSPKEQKQLEAMVEGLSGQDLNMLKEIFGQDASGPQAGGPEQLRIMIAALLKAGYSSHELKSLITDFQQGNFESPAINKFLNALDAAIAERPEEAAAPAPPRLPSPAEQEQNQSDWEKKFTELELSDTIKSQLRVILKRHAEYQRPLLTLLGKAGDQDKGKNRQVDFLTSLLELSRSRQDQLLEVIIHVNEKASGLAEKICQGSAPNLLTIIASCYNSGIDGKLIMKRRKLLSSFLATLKAKEQGRNKNPNTQQPNPERKPSAKHEAGEQQEPPSEKNKPIPFSLFNPYSWGFFENKN